MGGQNPFSGKKVTSAIKGNYPSPVGNDSPAQCTGSTKKSRFSHSTARDDVPLAKREQRFCLVDVSAAGRGGDRRPERGGSSDAGRTLAPRLSGAAGVRTPAAVRQRGGRGTLSARGSRVKDGCPNAGYGVVGGKGLRKPLPPAARRAGDHARMLGRSRQPATKKMEKNKAPTSPPARGGKNRYRPTD